MDNGLGNERKGWGREGKRGREASLWEGVTKVGRQVIIWFKQEWVEKRSRVKDRVKKL